MLRLYFTLVACCLLSLSGYAQKSATFPDGWLGIWKGEMHIITAKGIMQKVPMEIHISKGDSADTWNWQMIYRMKKDSPDVRPYVLKLVDKDKQHYVMDEKNSILLDSYFIDNVLWCPFEVQGTYLLTTNEVRGGKMISTIMYGPAAAVRTSGGTDEDTPPVKSFAVKGVQKCVMKRYKK